MKFLALLALLVSTAHATDFKPTYTAASAGFAPPATPTDLCVISGSATKKVRVRRAELFSAQTTAALNTFHLVKRSTANTGGTATNLTAVPMDSGMMAATVASLANYTANPTTGTSVGRARVMTTLSVASATSTLFPVPLVMDFDVYNDSNPIVLNGVAEELAINFGGLALPTGLTVFCSFAWTEE